MLGAFYSKLETIIPPKLHQWVAITSRRNLTMNLWFRRRKMKDPAERVLPNHVVGPPMQTRWVIQQEFQHCALISPMQMEATGLCIRWWRRQDGMTFLRAKAFVVNISYK
jgi:hypothetical protein